MPLRTAIGILAIGRLAFVSYTGLLAGLIYSLFLGPAIWSQRFGTHLPVILLCVAMAYARLRQRDSIGGGVWLAVAATLRIFPGVLLIALLVGRRFRAAVAMGAALVFLNLVPLLTPHVNLGTTLDAMTSTTSAWFDIESNISLGRAMSRLIEVGMPFMAIEAVVPIVIGLIVVRRQSLPMAAQWVLLLSIGVLALPVSWPQYLPRSSRWRWLQPRRPGLIQRSQLSWGWSLWPFLSRCRPQPSTLSGWALPSSLSYGSHLPPRVGQAGPHSRR